MARILKLPSVPIFYCDLIYGMTWLISSEWINFIAKNFKNKNSPTVKFFPEQENILKIYYPVSRIG